jgi:hypothetical protein
MEVFENSGYLNQFLHSNCSGSSGGSENTSGVPTYNGT